MKTFIEETKDLTPEERGAKLEGDEGEGIAEAHEVSAQVRLVQPVARVFTKINGHENSNNNTAVGDLPSNTAG